MNTIEIHRPYLEALLIPSWHTRMEKEMSAPHSRKTCTLASHSIKTKRNEFKWVFSNKYRIDKIIELYEAWLVAKGIVKLIIDYQFIMIPSPLLLVMPFFIFFLLYVMIDLYAKGKGLVHSNSDHSLYPNPSEEWLFFLSK